MFAKRVLAWSAMALVLPTIAAAKDFVASSELNQAGLQKFWQLALPLKADQTLRDIYVVDDQLYACTSDGIVFAVHADTGAVRWYKRVTRRGAQIKRPVHIDRKVMFVTSGEVVFYDRYSGDGIRRRDLNFACSTDPVVGDGEYYLGGANGRIYGFDLETDRQAWEIIIKKDVPIAPDMVYVNGSLCFATLDGKINGIRIKKHVGVWHDPAKTLGKIDGGVVIDEDNVYAVSTDQSLWSFDRTKGTVNWRARLSGPLYGVPTLVADTGFVFSNFDGVVAINLEAENDEDRILWKLGDGKQLLTVVGDKVFVLTKNGQIAAVAKDTGKVAKTIMADGFVGGTTIVDDAVMYLYSTSGKLFCARETGKRPPSRNQVVQSLDPAGPKAKAEEEVAKNTNEETKPTETSKKKPVGGTSEVTRKFLEGQGGDEE